MPTFSGASHEHITHWIKIFDKWCILSNFKDNQKSNLLSFVFIDSAAKILAAWDASDSIPADWEACKTKLITQFSDASRIKVYEATLLRRRFLPSETFDEYFADVLSLCSSVKPNMSDNDKIQNLLKGLPENVVQFLLFKEPKTTDDVLRGYSSFKTAKLLTAPLTANEPPIAAPALEETIASALVSKFENLMAAQNDKISEIQALVTKNLPEQKCFRCAKPGHMAKDCSIPRSPQPAPRRNQFAKSSDRQDQYPYHRSSSPRYSSQRDRPPSPYFSRHTRSPSPYSRRHPESRRNPSPSSDRYRDSYSSYHRRSPSPGRYHTDRYRSDRYPSERYYERSEN
jgi:hypothetical protein